MHLGDPVAQRVHDQLQHVRAAHERRVAGAGRVVVERLVLVAQPVVGGVVDAAERERGAEVIALGGVVVDDVEDHLDAGAVQLAHHRLELEHLLAALARGAVGVVRGEEADRVVAPVVREALVEQRRVLHELVHRHELDRRHAEAREVLDHRRVADGGVGAADLLGDAGMELRQALDVGLVDHGLVVGVARRAILLPVEERVRDDRLHDVRRGVLGVALAGVAELVGEARGRPVDRALVGLRVGIEQELAGIAAVAVGRVVGAVHAVAVALARLDARQVRVPHERVLLGHRDARLGVVVVEQAQLDALGDLREQREVGAGAVVRRAERIRASGPDLHRAPSGIACASVEAGLDELDEHEVGRDHAEQDQEERERQRREAEHVRRAA